GDDRFWLGAGAAFGLGMCAKYTTAFFAPGILLWLIAIPDLRRHLLNLWTWTGGLVATGLFAPVVAWDATHHWASFSYQTARMEIEQFTLRYLVELFGAQLILLTPPILVLGIAGLVGLAKRPRHQTGWLLLLSLVAPISVYFCWHSLHQRVQGNWPEAAYPA